MNGRLLLVACAVVAVLAAEAVRTVVELERAARRAKVGGGGSERLSVRNLPAPPAAVVLPAPAGAAGDAGAGGSVTAGPGASDVDAAFARLAEVHDGGHTP